MKKEKLWTKRFVLVTGANFFAAIIFYTTLTTFAGYALLTFEVNKSLAGFVAGAFILGSAFGRLYTGIKVDVFGRKRMTIIGGISLIVIGFGYLISPNIIVFIIVRLLHGMSFGMFHTAITTVATSLVPINRRGEGLGYYSLGFVTGIALGPGVGIAIIQNFSYDVLLVFLILVGIVALIMAMLTKIEEPVFEKDEQLVGLNPKKGMNIYDFFEKGALPMATIILILSMCFTAVNSFLETFTIEQGVENIMTVYFLLNGAVIFIVRPFVGKLFDIKGDNFVMYPAFIFYVVSLFVLSFANSFSDFMLVSVLMACGYGNILVMGQVIAVNNSPIQRVGIATSTFFVFSDIGQGIGPLLFGLIATHGTFQTMYFIEGFIAIACILLYYFLHGKKAAEKKRKQKAI